MVYFNRQPNKTLHWEQQMDDQYRLLEYKLWIALVALAEKTPENTVDDGADFAYNIEQEIKRLEESMSE